MIICVLIIIAASLSTSVGLVLTSSRHLAIPDYNSEFHFNEIEVWLNKKRSQLESTVFISYDKNGKPYPSVWYTLDDFMIALRELSVIGVGGGEFERFFYIGQTDNRGIVHGLVNVAAFLSHASVISIKYDACDEFNMDKTDYTEKYAVSNSCGQFGRSYQDEVCVGDTAHMTCDVDKDIQMTAVTSLNEERAAPALSCRAKNSATDFTGHWDRSTGTLEETFPFSNRMGRIDTAGCCWWGRGVLLTKGACNFGRLNHFLGYNGAAQGFLNYFDIDFCTYPNVVCEGEDSSKLRWSVGLFEWSDTVQTLYRDSTTGEGYLDALYKFIEGGFVNVNGFIDSIDLAFSYNCFEPNCKAEQSRVREERRFMFQNILFNILAVTELVQANPTPTPPPSKRVITPDPTPKPTMEPAVIIIKPPPTPAVVEVVVATPNPVEMSTQNPTTRPISTMPASSPSINPTLAPTRDRSISDLIKLQPSAGPTISISWIAIVFGCALHNIIL